MFLVMHARPWKWSRSHFGFSCNAALNSRGDPGSTHPPMKPEHVRDLIASFSNVGADLDSESLRCLQRACAIIEDMTSADATRIVNAAGQRPLLQVYMSDGWSTGIRSKGDFLRRQKSSNPIRQVAGAVRCAAGDQQGQGRRRTKGRRHVVCNIWIIQVCRSDCTCMAACSRSRSVNVWLPGLKCGSAPALPFGFRMRCGPRGGQAS